MHIQKYFWASIALVLALGLGAYFGNTLKKSPAEEYVPLLKTYNVPAERAGELKSILNALFWNGKDQEVKASAQAFGNGILLVKAPQGFHHGVEQLIKNVKARKSTKDQKISLDYWLVLAGGDEVHKSKNLKPLNKVIQSINEVEGQQNYRILEHLTSNTGLGREAEVAGWLSNAKTVVGRAEDNISLKMFFHSRFGQVRTSTQVKNGEFVVLGQSAVKPDKLKKLDVIDFNAKPKDISAKVYYVVRARVLK